MTEREIVLAMWADIARRRAESQGVISAVSLVLVHIMADYATGKHIGGSGPASGDNDAHQYSVTPPRIYLGSMSHTRRDAPDITWAEVAGQALAQPRQTTMTGV